MEDLEKFDASDFYPRSINAKEIPIRQKDDEFIFPIADATAKLSGRDYEFQEPALRRESTERRENLRVESHGHREEFQPEETEDDEEIHKDFWSIQGVSFIVIILNRKFNYTSREKIIPYSTEIQ